MTPHMMTWLHIRWHDVTYDYTRADIKPHLRTGLHMWHHTWWHNYIHMGHHTWRQYYIWNSTYDDVTTHMTPHKCRIVTSHMTPHMMTWFHTWRRGSTYDDMIRLMMTWRHMRLDTWWRDATYDYTRDDRTPHMMTSHHTWWHDVIWHHTWEHVIHYTPPPTLQL